MSILDRIGDLVLATGTGLQVRQDLPELGAEEIEARHHQVRLWILGFSTSFTILSPSTFATPYRRGSRPLDDVQVCATDPQSVSRDRQNPLLYIAITQIQAKLSDPQTIGRSQLHEQALRSVCLTYIRWTPYEEHRPELAHLGFVIADHNAMSTMPISFNRSNAKCNGRALARGSSGFGMMCVIG